MEPNKLRVVIDYAKLSEELQEQLKLVYPSGFSQHLISFKNMHGEMVSALRFETFEKIYLIRMSIKKAEELIEDDDDYDDDGNLRDDVKEQYEDDYSDVDYLSENDNYDD